MQRVADNMPGAGGLRVGASLGLSIVLRVEISEESPCIVLLK